jgi:DNA invertase Pin-like site-specific DNA recombinase
MDIYDAYVRVSDTHGEDGLSVPQQLERIQAWIDQHDDIEIGLRPEDGKPFTDLDVSGGSMDRPELNRIIERIKAGTSQGIVVAYMSRFGRTLEAGTTIKQIEEAGGELVSVRENFDTSTPTGKAMRAIALVFAQLELDNIKDNWSSHIRMAIDEGRAVGSIPIGYRRERNGKPRKDGTRGYGPLMIDESTADNIWRAFDVAGAYGLQDALDHLRREFPGRRWTATLAAELLGNRLYLGELSHGTDGQPNFYTRHFEHLRIVTLAEFQRAQHKPEDRIPRERRAPDFPLAGIATCASCDRGLVASVRQNAARRYRCTNRDCPGRAFPRADDLERLVLDAIRRDPPRLNVDEAYRLEADVEGASAALDAHDGKRDAYEALDELAVWQERRDELVRKLDVARVKAMPDAVAPMPDLSRDDLTPGDLRFVFKRAVESCTVKPANGQRGCIDKLVTLKLAA